MAGFKLRASRRTVTSVSKYCLPLFYSYVNKKNASSMLFRVLGTPKITSLRYVSGTGNASTPEFRGILYSSERAFTKAC